MRKNTIITGILLSLYGIACAQKGEKSIAAGPLISFPVTAEGVGGKTELKTGIGLEAQGQYNFTNHSAWILKSTLATWGHKENAISYDQRLTYLTLQGGYTYQFSPSGFFITGMAGTDIELSDGFASISFTLGAGKRFVVNETYFIDAGIDLVGGDAEGRVNIKALFSLFRWPKVK